MECHLDGPVSAIDIVTKMEGAVLIYPGGPIEEVDGYGFRYPYDLRLAGVDGCPYSFVCPFWITSQKVRCQFNRLFDPDAAGAKSAPGLLKEFSRRCIVQVYGKSIGEHEFHAAKGI